MNTIVRTKDTCFGKPRIRGTRIWTKLVLDLAVSYVKRDYPQLTKQQIRAALSYELRK